MLSKDMYMYAKVSLLLKHREHRIVFVGIYQSKTIKSVRKALISSSHIELKHPLKRLRNFNSFFYYVGTHIESIVEYFLC